MKGIVKNILIGASLVASVSAIASAPAQAASITGVTVGGSAPTDYFIYDTSGSKTVRSNDISLANVNRVLGGDATDPTGNIELAASSEQPSGFDFRKNTSISGKLNGKDITLSSLTASDWTPTFINQWLTAGLNANGFSSLASNQQTFGFLSTIFMNPSYGGPQRFSDPNISYVNQNDSTGLINIGLAGHYDASSFLKNSINRYITDQNVSSDNKSKAGYLLAALGDKKIQASEIVKVSYNGGPAQLLYGFSATRSGLVAADDNLSHSGNYEVSFQGVRTVSSSPKSTPEPSVMLGLLGVCGLLASQRKLKKAF